MRLHLAAIADELGAFFKLALIASLLVLFLVFYLRACLSFRLLPSTVSSVGGVLQARSWTCE
jgi:flagellar biosynthesis component FlhA